MRDDYDIGPGSIATGGGGAPSLSEIYDAAQEATRLTANGNSRLLALERAYDEAADTVFSITQQRLSNPVRSPVGPSTMQVPGASGGEDPHDAWDREISSLRERFPDKAPFLKGRGDVEGRAREMARMADEHQADIEARRPGFFSDPRATGAMLAGSFVGAMRDPANAITTAATGWIGFGKTLLWNAIGNGAVNAGTEALQQPMVQSWRKEAGLDYGLGHAASSVAMSAVFGGALDAGVRGTARALGAGRARLRGEDISVREAILEGITPREQLERAAKARQEGDVLRRAADGDEAAQIEVAREMGLDKADPEVRGAIHSMDAEREMQVAAPRAAVAEADHLAATAQALRHALDGEAPPRAPAALADVAPDPAARARLDAASDVVEAARVLRESPSALDGHPMADSEFMRVAHGLSRVSGDLAAHVEAGRVRADLAGLVGNMVEREADHLRLAQALERADPASEADARKLLSEALRAPRDAETMTALASPELPARTLAAERGEALARAMPDLLADPRIKGVLGDDGAAAIASLAAIRGPVSDALTRAAEQIAAGADKKATSRALASRIAGLIDERGLARLAESDGRVLAHGGIDDPTGAAAKLQIERLQRTVDWGDAGENSRFSLPDERQIAIQRVYDKIMDEARTKHGGDTNKVDWSEYLALVRGPRPAPTPPQPLGPIRDIGIGDIAKLSVDQLATLDKKLNLGVNDLTPEAVLLGIGQERIRRSHEAAKGHSATSHARDMDMRGRLQAEAKAEWAARVTREFDALSEAQPGAADAWREAKARGEAEFVDDGDAPAPVASTPASDARLNNLDEQAIRSVAAALNLLPQEISPRGLEQAIAQERIRVSLAATKGESAAASRSAWGGVSRTPDYVGVAQKAKADFDAKVDGVLATLGQVEPFSLRSGDYGLSPAASRDLPAIRAEVAEAAKALPADVRVRLEERLTFGDREIDGRYDIAERVVYASLAAADPARIVRHETIHALKASGLLTGGEYEILRRHAEGADLRKTYNIDDRYEKAYGAKLEELRTRAKEAKDADAETKAALQGDIAREMDRVEGLLWEETVAEMFADQRAGKSFGGTIDRILKTVADFLDRVRNALAGRGFKTVEDVFGAIEKGDVAGRVPMEVPSASRRASGAPQIEQVWGPKWDILMGQQYRIAEAGSDLSTMYDILRAKLAKASGIEPEMRAAMQAKVRELHSEMGPEGRRMAGIPETLDQFSIPDEPALSPRQAYDEAAGLMQQHELVGWCK